MTRYLVTGPQGFVGRYLVSHLLSSRGDYEVLGIGRSPYLKRQFTHLVKWGSRSVPAPVPRQLQRSTEERYKYVSADLARPDEVSRIIADFRPAFVFHLASGLRDDQAPALFRTNVEGTIGLLEAVVASNVSVKKVVIASTGGVYGVPAVLPIAEDSPCHPVDLYSVSKLAQEQSAQVMARQAGIRLAFGRIFNVVGPGQDERHICGQLAARVAGIDTGLFPPVVAIGSLENTRDFVDVRDVATALTLISDENVPDGVFNIASGRESSIGEVVRTILDVAGLADSVALQHCGVRKIDVPRHFASIRRVESLGFRPHYQFRQSLADLISYYLHLVRVACSSEPDGVPSFERGITEGSEHESVHGSRAYHLNKR